MQDRGLPLSSRTLTAAVYALCRASAPRPEEAEALMAEMEGAGVAAPDVWTWCVWGWRFGGGLLWCICSSRRFSAAAF